MARILVVDDEKKMTRVLKLLLDGEGHTTDTSGSAEDAVRLLDQYIYDIVVTDLKMPGKSGIDLLRDVKEKRPETEVVMMTAYATTRSAVEAMKSGAYDYIIKPFENDELLLLVKRILEKQSLTSEKTALAEENRELKKQIRGGLDKTGLIGRGERMQEVYRLVEKVAPTTTTVLIRGESGTGKELIARSIHVNSQGAEGSFVPVHCAAYPETLLESELFGHEKGAFTGAATRRIGRFEKAAGGTLFLDEVGEISPTVQVKLLRVLQERSFERLGGDTAIHTDARIVAATNRNLEQAMEEGLFREDLFYRLYVFPIELPPLRERMDDLDELIAHFLEKFEGKGVRITRKARTVIQRHGWPGNVRELENAIERALILAGGDSIDVRHLPEILQRGSDGDGLTAGGVRSRRISGRGETILSTLHLETMEKEMIQSALARAGGNKSRAAELLGITRRALYSRMERHKIPISGEERSDDHRL